MKMEQTERSVTSAIKFRRRGITQNKARRGITQNKARRGITQNKARRGITQNKARRGITQNKAYNKFYLSYRADRLKTVSFVPE